MDSGGRGLLDAPYASIVKVSRVWLGKYEL
jgi:hypothetical protein